jgi:hypothetical protein
MVRYAPRCLKSSCRDVNMKKGIIILLVPVAVCIVALLSMSTGKRSLSPEEIFRCTVVQSIPPSVTNIHVYSLDIPTFGDGGALFQFDISPADFSAIIAVKDLKQRDITEYLKSNRLFSDPRLELANPEYYVSGTNSLNYTQIKVNGEHTRVIVDFNGFFRAM